MPDLTAGITEILREHHAVPIEDRFLGRAHLVRCGSSDCHWRGRDYEIAEHHAALIAQAAQEHYRPRVETARDLADLPDATVVLTETSCHQRIAGQWREIHACEREVFGAPDLPAVVLWTPGVGE